MELAILSFHTMKPFRYLENLETSIKAMRLMLLFCLLMTLVLSLGAVFMSLSYVKDASSRIYILSSEGQVQEADLVDESYALELSARFHTQYFHELFFTLSPSSESIQYNISRALELSDESAWGVYEDFREQGYYQRLIQSGAVQSARVDSVEMDLKAVPYRVRTHLTEMILRQSTVVKRLLVTEGVLYPVQRSRSNPAGFILKNFKVISSQDDKIMKR